MRLIRAPLRLVRLSCTVTAEPPPVAVEVALEPWVMV